MKAISVAVLVLVTCVLSIAHSAYAQATGPTRVYFELYLGNNAKATAVGYYTFLGKPWVGDITLYTANTAGQLDKSIHLAKVSSIEIDPIASGRPRVRVFVDGQSTPESGFMGVSNYILETDAGVKHQFERREERVILKRVRGK